MQKRIPNHHKTKEKTLNSDTLKILFTLRVTALATTRAGNFRIDASPANSALGAYVKDEGPCLGWSHRYTGILDCGTG